MCVCRLSSVCLSVCLSSVCLSVCMSSVCLSVCMFPKTGKQVTQICSDRCFILIHFRLFFEQMLCKINGFKCSIIDEYMG